MDCELSMIALTTMAATETAKFALSTLSTIPVTTCDKVKERLREAHDIDGLKWRDIANQDEYKGIAPGTLCRFAKGNWEPRGYYLRHRLGLPNAVSVVPIAGIIPENSQALCAQQCLCGRYFISNHPRRMKCFICSPFRGKKGNRHA